MNHSPGKRTIVSRWNWLAIGLALSLLTGCRTISSDSLTAFTSGVGTARTISQETFSAVKQMVAEASLEYAVQQPRLTEASFAAGLDDESLAAWDQILANLERYAQHLQVLTSPDIPRQFGDAAVNLGSSFKDFGVHLQEAGLINKSPSINPGIAAGFTELGELLLHYQAERRAQKALAAADPEIARIMRALADSVGNSLTNGIRGTVHAHWDQRLAEEKTAFMGAAEADKKRQAASDFRDMLQRRSAQDLVLLSLRRSLLQLADLHHALALGDRWNAQSAAAAINAELQQTRDLNRRFQEQSNQP